jgi:hypothetical protein
MCLTDGATEPGFLSRNDNQTHMLGHPAKTPYLDPFFSTPLGYQIEIFLAIFVPGKTPLSDGSLSA